jgi:branched-chain amino acid transport system substrate-binding protein
MNTWIRFVSIVAVATLLGGTVPPALAEDPYEINVMMSLTGPIAFLGKEEAESIRGVETIVNRTGGIRGRPVKFVIHDIQTNPVVAVQVANQLLAKQVPVILGPDSTSAAVAIEPLVKNNLVLYAFTPAIHPPAGSYVFSSFISTRDLSMAGLRFLRKKGVKRLAIINSTDTAGVEQLNEAQENAALPENKSIDIVAVEHFAQSDVSVAAQVARMKAAAPQAVYIMTTGNGYGNVLRAMHDSGLDVPVITPAGNIITAQVVQYESFMPREAYFTGGRFLAQNAARPGPVRDAQQLFYRQMREQGTAALDVGTNLPWDTAWIVVSGLRKFGTGMTAAQLRDFIANLHGFAGINGIMDFRDGSQRGLTPSAALVVRWDSVGKTWIPQ